MTRSSVEAELRATVHGICEVLWTKILMKDLRFPIDNPMNLYCDNKVAFDNAHNPIEHDQRTFRWVDISSKKSLMKNKYVCHLFPLEVSYQMSFLKQLQIKHPILL